MDELLASFVAKLQTHAAQPTSPPAEVARHLLPVLAGDGAASVKASALAALHDAAARDPSVVDDATIVAVVDFMLRHDPAPLPLRLRDDVEGILGRSATGHAVAHAHLTVRLDGGAGEALDLDGLRAAVAWLSHAHPARAFELVEAVLLGDGGAGAAPPDAALDLLARLLPLVGHRVLHSCAQTCSVAAACRGLLLDEATAARFLLRGGEFILDALARHTVRTDGALTHFALVELLGRLSTTAPRTLEAAPALTTPTLAHGLAIDVRAGAPLAAVARVLHAPAARDALLADADVAAAIAHRAAYDLLALDERARLALVAHLGEARAALPEGALCTMWILAHGAWRASAAEPRAREAGAREADAGDGGVAGDGGAAGDGGVAAGARARGAGERGDDEEAGAPPPPPPSLLGAAVLAMMRVGASDLVAHLPALAETVMRGLAAAAPSALGVAWAAAADGALERLLRGIQRRPSVVLSPLGVHGEPSHLFVHVLPLLLGTAARARDDSCAWAGVVRDALRGADLPRTVGCARLLGELAARHELPEIARPDDAALLAEEGDDDDDAARAARGALRAAVATCAVTLEPMHCPVILSDGRTYELATALALWRADVPGRSPLTRESVCPWLVYNRQAVDAEVQLVLHHAALRALRARGAHAPATPPVRPPPTTPPPRRLTRWRRRNAQGRRRDASAGSSSADEPAEEGGGTPPPPRCRDAAEPP